MSADFRPELGAYKSLKPFVFWAQATLPTVFDDSLSYYESVSKLAKMINTLLENVDTSEQNIERLAQAYDELQDYVNHYFDNLDVQNEINNKLDSMVTSGELTELIEPFLPDAATIALPPIVSEQLGGVVATQIGGVVEEKLPTQFEVGGAGSESVADWLATHITTPSSVVIDNSLTIDGAAADAGATGRAIDNVDTQFNRVISQTYDVPIYSTGTTNTTLDPDTGVISSIDPETAEIITGTCKFEVFGGGKVLFSGIKFMEITDTGYAFYDVNDTYISGGYHTENPANIVNVPANAYYCVVCYNANDVIPPLRGEQYVTNFSTESLQEIIEYLNDIKQSIPAPTVIDPTLTVEGAAADAKATGDALNKLNSDVESLSSYNSCDLLRQFAKPTKSTSNITVTWDGDVATVNGTAIETAEGLCNFYNNTAAMPEGFSAGQTLFIHVTTSSTNLSLGIIPYISGTDQPAQYFTADGEYTIPDGTTGIVIRLRIIRNITFENATFSANILSALPNTEIAKNRDAIDVNKNNLLDYNSAPLVTGDPSLNNPNKNGVSYTWDENSTCITAGTSTAISFCTLYEDMTKLPDGLNAGDTVWFDCESTNPLVRGVVSFFDSNSTKVGETFATSPTAITVPSNAVGARIRISMNSGVNAAGTIRIRLLSAKSNLDLQNDIGALQARVGATVKTPMLTIIDDDGNSAFYTDLYALAQNENVPISCAIPYSSIGAANHLTLAQVKEMYGNGIEILSHTYSHWTDFTDKSEADFEVEFRKAKYAFNLIGIPCELLVYSGSSGNLAVAKTAASHVYGGAIASGNEHINYCDGNKYFIERYGVTGNGAGGRLNGENLESLTHAIDDLVADGGWMIWMLHTSESYWSANMLTNIGLAIDYALTNGVPIVTAEYGFKTYFGN